MKQRIKTVAQGVASEMLYAGGAIALGAALTTLLKWL